MDNVAIVILNFNGKNYLEKFLPSVVQYSSNCQIIVADNCSTDDSVAWVKKHYPQVNLILLDKNYGFSHGYNEALKQVHSDYYVLLNSDVEVTENWINPVIELFEKNPQIAAAQPKILSWHSKKHFEYAGAAGGFIDILGYPFCRGRLFTTLEEDKGQYNDSREIFWATGACLFIRSDIYNRMGGFDESFFAHMEEIDLCWRINNQGNSIFYCGESTVYHVGGGTLSRSNPRKTYLNFKNGLTLLFKNLPLFYLLWILPLRILLDIVASVKFFFFDSPKDALAILKAHLDFTINFFDNVRSRKHVSRIIKSRKIHPSIFKGFIIFYFYLFKRKYFSDLKFYQKK